MLLMVTGAVLLVVTVVVIFLGRLLGDIPVEVGYCNNILKMRFNAPHVGKYDEYYFLARKEKSCICADYLIVDTCSSCPLVEFKCSK